MIVNTQSLKSLYRVLIIFCFGAILVNFKVGPVYLSFVFTLLLAFSGLLYYITSIEDKASLLYLALVMLCVFFNFLLVKNGVFIFWEKFIQGWLKLFTVLFIALYTQKLLKLGRISIRFLQDTFIYFVSFFCIRYFIENVERFPVLDSIWNRPEADWIGGINQFSSTVGIALFLLLKPFEGKYSRLQTLTLGLLFIFCLLTSMSRGGMYAFLFSYVAVQSLKRWKTLIIIMLFCFVIGVFITYLDLDSFFWQNFTGRYINLNLSQKNLVAATSGRNLIWMYTIESFFSSSLVNIAFGKGVGTFQFDSYADPHNSFLHLIWEFGIIGFLLFGLVFGKLLISLLKVSNYNIRIASLGLGLIFVINMLFESYFYTTQTGWFLGLFSGVFMTLQHRD